MRFSKWLDTLVSEKGYDPETLFTVQGNSGENLIPLGCVLDAIKATTPREQVLAKVRTVRPGVTDSDWEDLMMDSDEQESTR